VIKFGSVYDAYGFFSILKGAGVYEAAQINEDYTNASAVIRIGEYIIYAVTEQSDLLMRKDLKTFVNVPLMYIGRNYSENNLPESLNILKGKDGYGVMYSRRPHYKFPLLSGINITQWAWNTDVINVYCAETKSFYDSYSIFKKSTENGYIVVSSDNIYTAFKTEEDGKYIFISVSDKWIYGCWALKDFNDGKKVLNEIRLRIEDYKKKGKK
jgi:hypothetical protein